MMKSGVGFTSCSCRGGIFLHYFGKKNGAALWVFIRFRAPDNAVAIEGDGIFINSLISYEPAWVLILTRRANI
jgi:hypothetical protein